jgi:hypothetical protein
LAPSTTEAEKTAGAARRPRSAFQRSYAALVSPRLAIAILVAVLLFCLAGVTVLRGQRAWELIFSTLWFNGLLVLLAVSSAAAFFTRIWRRKLTLVSAGMILFHVSFAALLGGVVFNGLYRFKGSLRLTEGETLPNGSLESYDAVEHGRLFDVGRLRGTTTLLRMHRNYRVDGSNKWSAYEVAVEDGGSKVREVIYVTRHLDFEGVRYFCAKEGYSVLVIMNGKDGRELYGAHVPLQSLRQPDGSYLYATGTTHGPGRLHYPAKPEEPRVELLLTYRPNAVVDRSGDVGFQVSPLGGPHGAPSEPRTGTVRVGGQFDAGDFTLTPREIRYWVGMDVRYDPGLPVIMSSLVAGFAGTVLMLAGRVRQGAARRQAA